MSIRTMFRSHDVILLYHRVAVIDSDPWSLCITPEDFAEHLEVLRKCAPIRLEQVSLSGRYGATKPRVAVTFDDGYADNLYAAKPLLERYDIPATVFVVTGYVGQDREFWWDELQKIVLEPATLPQRLQFTSTTCSFDTDESSRSSLYASLYHHLQPISAEERRDILDQLLAWSQQSASVRESHRTMSAEEVCQLAKGGLVEIGSHTVTHPLLTLQSVKRQKEELRNSKKWLEDLCGRSIASFSYPFGGSKHYSPETMRQVNEAGYLRACTTTANRVTKDSGRYELPRFNGGDMTADDLERLLFG